MSACDLPQLGDWASSDELYELHRERLPQVLEAARRCERFRSRLPDAAKFDVDAWSALPLTTKEDLRAAYPLGLLAVPFERLATYHESSGTSGLPTSSYLTERDWLDVASRFARGLGLGSGDAVLVNTPYSMLTTAHQMTRAAALCEAVVVPAGNRTWNMPYARVMRLLRDLPIALWWCVPTNAMLVALAARDAGHDPAANAFTELRTLLVAGEALSEGRRRRLSSLWGGRRVVQDYGSTETGSLAGECEHGTLHLWADRILFEVLDRETGRAAREGIGELVVTPLFREAMPLVRYQLEDTVEVRHEPCACGWKLPSVRVIGRASSRLTVQGNSFYPVELEDVVYGLPQEHGVLLWRALHSEREIEIEIEVEPAAAPRAAAALREAVRVRLRLDAQVRAVDPGSIVPRECLTASNRTLKPSYVFSARDGWPRDYQW